MDRFFKVLDRIFNTLSAVLLGGMVLIIFLQVITRVMQISLTWTTEITQYMFVWVTFIAGYLGARKGRHIGVELFQNMLPKPVKRVMAFFSWALASIYYGLVLFYCIELWPKLGIQTTPILKWPMNFVYGGMMIGLFSMSLYFIYYAFTFILPSKDELESLKTKVADMNSKEQEAEEV